MPVRVEVKAEGCPYLEEEEERSSQLGGEVEDWPYLVAKVVLRLQWVQ